METRKDNTLENLPAEKREVIMELALNCARLLDVLEPLKAHGIDVSLSTLQRFVRRHRDEKLLKDGEDMKETVASLARRGRGEDLRKGTIEALRQKVYEGALETSSPEVAREALGELLQEEARLKELALAEEKMALAKEQLALQRLRIEVQAEAARIGVGRGRRRVSVESAPVVAGELAAPREESFTEGNKGNEDGTEKNGHEGTQRSQRKEEEELREMAKELEGIMNRGGRAEEKVLAARAVLENRTR